MLMNRKTNKKEKRKKNIKKKKKTEEIGLHQQELKIHHLVKTFLEIFHIP